MTDLTGIYGNKWVGLYDGKHIRLGWVTTRRRNGLFSVWKPEGGDACNETDEAVACQDQCNCIFSQPYSRTM